jgi:7,8-dihydro-6-hydroxymethylpterin-pyrophosphokinase
MRERRFVLEPLVEIAPGLRDPLTNELFANSLRAVRGQKVTRVGIVCPPGNQPR